MKFFFYFLVVLISIITITNPDIFSHYAELLIKKSLLDISNLTFAFIYLFFIVVLAFFGVSVSILVFGYFLFLDLYVAFLFSFVSIILSGVVAYFFLSRSDKEKPLFIKYKIKFRKFNLFSPYFPIVLRLIPGVPFMAQNIILIELNHSFLRYFISLVIVAMISSSIFTFLAYSYEF